MMRFERAIWMLLTSYMLLFLGAVLNFILIPIVIQHIGQSGYGTWIIIIAFVNYLGMLDFGIGAAVVRFVAHLSGQVDYSEPMSRLLSSAFTLRCGVGLLVLLVGAASALTLPSFIEIPMALRSAFFWVLAIELLRLASNFPLGVFGSVLRGLQRNYITNIVNATLTMFGFILNILLLRRGLGLVALVLPSLVLGLVEGAFLYLLARRYLPGTQLEFGLFDHRLGREMVSFGFLMFLSTLAAKVVFSTDTLVAGAVIGVAGSAVYQLTYKVAEMLTQISFRVADATLPAIAELHGRGEIGSLQAVHMEVVRLTTAVAAPSAILYFFLNEDFVRLWVGSDAYGGRALTLAFAYLTVHHSLLHTSGVALIGAGQVRGIAYMSLIEAALNLAISIYLAHMMGLVGVALGTVIAGILTSGWYAPYTACKVLRTPLAQYLSEGILPVIRVGIPYGLVVFAVHKVWTPQNLVELLGVGAGLAGLYVVGFILFGINAEERILYGKRLLSLFR